MRFILALLLSIPLIVSAQTTIKLDGKINPDEWKNAVEHSMEKSGKVLLKQVANILHVAFVCEKKIWGHVYLSNGSDIRIIHASAALGDVLYKKDGSVWNTSDAFHYQLRDTVYNDQLIAAMDFYYQTHGWVANNGSMASGKVIEFKIDLKKFPDYRYFACVVSDYDSKFSWYPGSLKDDTLFHNLVMGNTPNSLTFKIEQWEKIR